MRDYVYVCIEQFVFMKNKLNIPRGERNAMIARKTTTPERLAIINFLGGSSVATHQKQYSI